MTTLTDSEKAGLVESKTDDDDFAPDIIPQEIKIEGEAELRNEFWIYHKHKITGPHTDYNIFRLYFSNQISDEIWVMRVSTNNWIKINLSDPDKNSDELQDKLPKLYNYLIPKLKSIKLQQFDPPTFIPKDAEKKLSWTVKIIQIIGRIVAFCVAVIIGFHVIITGLIPFLCYIIFRDKMTRIWNYILIIVSLTGFIITPCIIVYIILLSVMNYSGWNGEIQSWMIAYIAWGICSFLFIVYGLLTYIKEGLYSKQLVRFIFWIIGVDFAINPGKLVSVKGYSYLLEGAEMFLFPAMAALLPAVVIGFIANYVLQEQFLLECHEDIQSDICFDNEYGCCRVISSHDVKNAYSFMGGLAANILATWGIIRFIAYFMIHITFEISMYAKRHIHR